MPSDVTDSARRSADYVVGIGASAGGLEALERLFRAMPTDTGMAFVLIQHLSPDFKSLMDELLGRFTQLAIERVSEPTTARADTIYLLPPSKEMIMEGGKLTLVERLADQGVHLPINRFFRSLARDRGDRAIAIVLSGSGSDGSAGIADVHDAGGVVLAQSEATAKFDGMPRAAIATGFVDQVLAPEDMAALLVRYVTTNALSSSPGPQSVDSRDPDEALKVLFDRLREAHGIDFQRYKPATIVRRIERRMQLFSVESLGEYTLRALGDPSELEALFRDLLIGVTRFFRDPEAFDVLRERVVANVVASVPPDDDIRVWVPACATGEEAYSIAMLFLQELDNQRRPPNLRVFASDAHPDSLRFAAEGVYPPEALEALPAALRDRYFQVELDGRLRVSPKLRKTVLFSVHNVLKDVPFNRIDLVSCRNLLIYFDSAAQQRALGAFHFALKPKGILFLGPSESIGELERDLEVVDRTWKIYRKIREGRSSIDLRLGAPIGFGSTLGRAGTLGDAHLQRVYDRLLDRYMPPGVLVNERREVLHTFGGANKFFRPASGRASLDIIAMCDGELSQAIASSVSRARRGSERVEVHGVRTRVNDKSVVVDVSAEPYDLGPTSAKFVLIQLVEVREVAPEASEQAAVVLSEDAAARIQDLETELQDARLSMQALMEEMETTNEELQASNEELLASNEELQSTNEELQSVNEELYSVNAEHNQRIRDLAATSADLRNLMAAVHAGIIFTDNSEIIRLFTPGAAQILNVMPQDVGRPLSHITSRIEDDDVYADMASVRARHVPVEKVVQVPDGRYFLRRILPYEDAERVQSGFVITFEDVTERQRAAAVQEALNEFLKAVINAFQAQIVVIDQQSNIVMTNRAWDEFGPANGGQAGSAFIGKRYLDAIPGTPGDAVSAQARDLIHEVLSGRRPSGDLDYVCPTPAGERWFWMNVTRVPLSGAAAVISHTDVTARKQAVAMESALRESAKLESLGVLAGGIAHDFNNILAGVMANIGLMQLEVGKDSPLQEALTDIDLAARRAADLCKQMLAYAGRGQFLLEKVDLCKVVKDTMSLVRASIRKDARLSFSLAEEALPVEADAAQLQQVVMNLTINASEALGKEGGDVRVTTGRTAERARPGDVVVIEPDKPVQRYVFFEISDNGSGIAPSELGRIFEPFYTTKFTGRGLGLSAVLGIVRSHHGYLFVRSTPGQGTIFRMLLPEVEGLVESPAPTRSAPLVTDVSRKGTVLIVDDEMAVRKALQRVVSKLGYDCMLAQDGESAIEIYLKHPGAIDIILLDLTMPGMGGARTHEALLRISPDVRIVVMSGFSESQAREQTGKLAAFIQKPIDLDTLEGTLERMRRSPGEGPSGPVINGSTVVGAV